MSQILNIFLKNPTGSLIVLWGISFPIYVIVKNKLEDGYDHYPNISKYERQFKKHNAYQNEQSKPNKSLF